LKKDTAWEFGDEQKRAWDKLKTAIAASPILTPPDFEKEFYLDTDASGDGIGGALLQVGEDNRLHAVAYVSRRLLDRERSFSVRELEALAILWCIEQLRDMLVGRKFTVVTDHSSLRWMPEIEGAKTRIDRWWNKIRQNYYFDIVYREGRQNVVADCLSRNPIEGEAKTNADALGIEAQVERLQVLMGLMAEHKSEREHIAVNVAKTKRKNKSKNKPVEKKKELPASQQQPIQPQPVEEKKGPPSPQQQPEQPQQHPQPPQPQQADPLPPPDPEGKEAMPEDGVAVREKRAWGEALRLSPAYGDLIKFIEEKQQPGDRSQEALQKLRKQVGLFSWDGSHLWHFAKTAKGEETKLLVVPEKYRRRLLVEYHDDTLGGHRGEKATRDTLRRSFYWESLSSDVAKHIEDCHRCAVVKKRPGGLGLLGHFDLDPTLFEVLHRSLAGLGGGKYLHSHRDRQI
jgi:hypothetical protein